MDIFINNTSRTSVYVKTGESRRFQKVKAGSSVCVKVQDIAVTLLVKPGGNTVYSNTMSQFVVLSEYSFSASDNMTLSFSFETAKADIDGAFHGFRRVSLQGFNCPYNVVYSVILPDRIKKGFSGFFWESLSNLFLDAGLPLLSGLIVWVKTGSIGKALIAAAVTLAVVTAVTLGTEKLFDKLHDKARERKGLASDKEPIGLAQCLDPNYIDCMFKKAGF